MLTDCDQHILLPRICIQPAATPPPPILGSRGLSMCVQGLPSLILWNLFFKVGGSAHAKRNTALHKSERSNLVSAWKQEDSQLLQIRTGNRRHRRRLCSLWHYQSPLLVASYFHQVFPRDHLGLRAILNFSCEQRSFGNFRERLSGFGFCQAVFFVLFCFYQLLSLTQGSYTSSPSALQL